MEDLSFLVVQICDVDYIQKEANRLGDLFRANE